jgi:hypothetical protein
MRRQAVDPTDGAKDPRGEPSVERKEGGNAHQTHDACGDRLEVVAVEVDEVGASAVLRHDPE